MTWATATITAGTYSTSMTPSNPIYSAGDTFRVDVVQIGSATPGADLTATVGGVV